MTVFKPLFEVFMIEIFKGLYYINFRLKPPLSCFYNKNLDSVTNFCVNYDKSKCLNPPDAY